MFDKKMLFLIGCLGSRFGLAYAVRASPPNLLPLFGKLALIPAFGFIIIYLLNLRKTGIEAQGEIWWDNWRPLHASMYILFSLLSLKKKSFAWIVLLVDAIFGLIAWVNKYIFR